MVPRPLQKLGGSSPLVSTALMVEIPEGVSTRPLEIEQSYELVH